MSGIRFAAAGAVGLVVLFQRGLAQEPPTSAPLPSHSAAVDPTRLVKSFAPGEELTYAVKYGPVRAGTARLSVLGLEWANGGMCYRLRYRVQSAGFFSSFFKVDDLTESWLDVQKMMSRRFVRILEEGSYRKNEAVQIDPDRGVAFYAPRGDTVEVLAGAQDVLSIFYLARSLDLKPGQAVTVPAHVNRKNAQVEIRSLGRERVKVPAGVFQCTLLEPGLETAGLVRDEGRLTLWISDDSDRIPVIIKTKLKVGSITAMLVSHQRAPAALPGSTR
jgi:hypothetical protein